MNFPGSIASMDCVYMDWGFGCILNSMLLLNYCSSWSFAEGNMIGS